MNKLLVGIGLAIGLSAGIATSQGVASATATNPHARCIGQIVSSYAGPGFGAIAVDLVRVGEIRHTGQEASTNVCE